MPIAEEELTNNVCNPEDFTLAIHSRSRLICLQLILLQIASCHYTTHTKKKTKKKHYSIARGLSIRKANLKATNIITNIVCVFWTLVL